MWRARGGIDDVEIPDSVHAVILARLDLLSLDEKRVAQRAAVVGRVFWDGAVATIAPVDDLDAALSTLRRREFVVEALSSSIAGHAEFSFKHVLIRDVAYESLPRKERGRAHAETADWIERTSGEGTRELAEVLAHHYDAAFSYLRDDDLRRKARAQLLAAAANAHRRFAIQQGERFAQRAVELSEGGAERVEALEALGDLHYLAYFGDAAWRTYGEALAETVGERSRLRAGCGQGRPLRCALDRNHARAPSCGRGRTPDRRRAARGARPMLTSACCSSSSEAFSCTSGKSAATTSRAPPSKMP